MIKQLTVVLLTNKYSNKCVVHASVTMKSNI